jgi:hypothetical protein
MVREEDIPNRARPAQGDRPHAVQAPRRPAPPVSRGQKAVQPRACLHLDAAEHPCLAPHTAGLASTGSPVSGDVAGAERK